MSFGILDIASVIEKMENHMDANRPEESIRKELDIAYKIEDQSIILYEIRPYFLNPKEIIESPYAKTTFVKSKNQWKIYWMRGNLKWYPYKPEAVKTLDEFLELVEADEFGCFKG